MVIVCAWCRKYLGTREPVESSSVTHTICPTCRARQEWRDRPTLIVSRERADLVPVLQDILRGVPEIQLVVDRRTTERRSSNNNAATHQERRRPGNRRRDGSPLILG